MARVVIPRREYNLCLDLRAQGLDEYPAGRSVIFQGPEIRLRRWLWGGPASTWEHLAIEGRVTAGARRGEYLVLTDRVKHVAFDLPGAVYERAKSVQERMGVRAFSAFVQQAILYYCDLCEGRVYVKLRSGEVPSAPAKVGKFEGDPAGELRWRSQMKWRADDYHRLKKHSIEGSEKHSIEGSEGTLPAGYVPPASAENSLEK